MLDRWNRLSRRERALMGLLFALLAGYGWFRFGQARLVANRERLRAELAAARAALEQAEAAQARAAQNRAELERLQAERRALDERLVGGRPEAAILAELDRLARAGLSVESFAVRLPAEGARSYTAELSARGGYAQQLDLLRWLETAGLPIRIDAWRWSAENRGPSPVILLGSYRLTLFSADVAPLPGTAGPPPAGRTDPFSP